MAKTNAEHQREWRRRRREAKEEALKTEEAGALTDVFCAPFFEAPALTANWSDIELELDAAGLDARPFDDDRGPSSTTGIIEDTHEAERLGPAYAGSPHNSLSRAEVMIGGLISAAAQLAAVVNDYKQTEIKARIAEIEQSDLSDPETKRRALADIVRLQKMLDQLSKQVRWAFPQWKVTGV